MVPPRSPSVKATPNGNGSSPVVPCVHVAPAPPAGPLPSIDATRLGIAARVIRRAIATYEEAQRWSAEVEGAVGDDNGSARWASVTSGIAFDTRHQLVRAILALGMGDVVTDAWDLERRYYPTCGVRLGGKLYLAIPDVDAEEILEVGQAREDNVVVMTLRVTDVSAVAEIGGADVVELDDEGPAVAMTEVEDLDEAEPDPPAPGPRIPQASREDIAHEVDLHSPHVRPGRRVFAVVSGDYLHERTSRVGLTLAEVLAEEMEFTPDTFEDRAIWEQSNGEARLRAVIRTGKGMEPDVVRFGQRFTD